MYFSKVVDGDITSNTFELAGINFYNCVEFGSNPGGTDEFVISDTSDRKVPICVEDIDSLIQILYDIKDRVSLIHQTEDLSEKLENMLDDVDAVCDPDAIMAYLDAQSICTNS